MPGAGVAVHETTVVPIFDLREVERRVEEAMVGVYRLVVAGDGTYQFVRSYRPLWARILAGITAVPLLGGGLLFLLVRRSEACTISVTPGPRGAMVGLNGTILPLSRDVLRAALSRLEHRPHLTTEHPLPSPSLASSVGASPHAAVDDVQEATMHRSQPGPLRPLTVTTQPVDAILVFDSGQVVPLTTTVLVGRDPAPMSAADTNAQLASIADETFSISKTHFAVGLDEAGLWIEDRNSTNGTAVFGAAGERETLLPGERRQLPLGAVVSFGERRVQLKSP